jgi:hypothetical protein
VIEYLGDLLFAFAAVAYFVAIRDLILKGWDAGFTTWLMATAGTVWMLLHYAPGVLR